MSVKDNDRPPTPTRLRANGNLDSDGNVTLRWKPVSRATGYNVRYIEEVCDSDGVCEPDPDGSWQTRTNIATSGILVKEATFGGLTKKKLYRIEVQVVIVDYSNWSDFTLVFPTDSPLGGGIRVATAPFHGYQPNKNAQGSHEFRYVICEESITSSITTSPADPNLSRSQQAIIDDIGDAVDKWEETVIWNGGSANIISAEAYSLPAGLDCGPRILGVPLGRNEVVFASNFEMTTAGCFGPPPACWRTHRWQAVEFGPIGWGAILLRASYGADWNALDTTTGCTYLHQIVVHEAGHSFGIGNGSVPRGSFNQHPINTMHSVMSYDDPNDYCEPQAYDIVALMALYQSR